MKQHIVTIGAALLLAGCNPMADTKAAEDGVSAFHDAFNAGRFDAIYSTADTRYKSIGTSAQSTEFLAGVRAKMGRFQSGSTVSWHDNVDAASGHQVTLTRKAKFERGEGQETFVFNIAKNGKATLAGYHINSPAFASK
jgi:hypothetical protein